MVGGKDGDFIYWYKFDDVEPYFSRWVLFFYLPKLPKGGNETKKTHKKLLENRRENDISFPPSQLQRWTARTVQLSKLVAKRR